MFSIAIFPRKREVPLTEIEHTPQVLELNLEIKRVNRLRLRGSLAAGLAFAILILFTDRNASSIRLVELCGSLLSVAA
ncbi:MAG: hypothetical protein ACLGI9_15655, partial [Thermoanaerobaculia bacterium]